MAGAVAIAAIVVAAMSILSPTSAPSAPPPSSSLLQDGEPHILSEADLRDFGVENGPLYWAGPRDDVEYELTYTTAGWVYIRYLPVGTPAGDDGETYLTVGNYVVDDGYNELVGWGTAEGYSIVTAQSGAAIVTEDADPLRAYFAFPDLALQIEVFDPEEGSANELVSDGSVILLERGE